MTFDEAREHIVSAIAASSKVLAEPRFAAAASKAMDIEFSDLALDSLAAMEICMDIEERAGIAIDLGDLAIHSSINALAKHVVELSSRNSLNAN
jgi:acyl carrier protein